MQAVVVVRALPAEVSLGLDVALTDLLHALRETHAGEELCAEHLVIASVSVWHGHSHFGIVQLHDLSEVVEKRADDELCVNGLVILALEVINGELRSLQRVVHERHVVADVVGAAELLEQLEDLLDGNILVVHLGRVMVVARVVGGRALTHWLLYLVHLIES